MKRSAGAVTYCRALLGLGTRRALLISGLVHGLWELPAMIWTSFDHGAGNRLIVIPLFLLTLRLASVCFSFLRLTTGSVRPAALAHSGFKIFSERFDGFTETRSPLVLEYLAGEGGLLTLFALAVLAGWLDHWSKPNRDAPEAVHF